MSNTTTAYDELVRIQKEYPELTFQNNGYEYIHDILEKHSNVVKEIGKIIRNYDHQFVKFHNFKMRDDGTFYVRYDAYYTPGMHSGFQGVVYQPINNFKEVILDA